MRKSHRPHVALIRDALRQISVYNPGDRSAFLANPMAQDAILMRLQEIGENLARIRRLDEELFVEIAPESWYRLIGLRNIISHGYHLVEAERIWLILDEELARFAMSIDEADGQLL